MREARRRRWFSRTRHECRADYRSAESPVNGAEERRHPHPRTHLFMTRLRNSLDSAAGCATIAPMNRITGIHHTSFTVVDLDRSLAFFRDRLGLEVVSLREIRAEYFGAIVGLPGCVVKAALLRLPAAQQQIELLQYLTPPTVPGGQRPRPCDAGSHHLALQVTDLVELCRELRSHGVELLSEPVAVTAGPNAGAWAVYLRDPNGILIELFQPPPP
jgi:catechol 2,3-dioxygenase-like lactoylglutathione lyase family enzyme